MKRLLVTGAAGFIGSNFIQYWRSENPADEIVVLDALTYAGNKHNLADLDSDVQFTFVQGSICDQNLVDKLLRDHNIDTMVHFAAESHVDRSITGPDAFIETNMVGTHTLLKAAKQSLDQAEADEKVRAARFAEAIELAEQAGEEKPDTASLKTAASLARTEE